MKTLIIKPGNQQKGYVVILTIAMLAALLTLSLSFFERATGNMKLGGYNRDSVESLLLAETAMNTLFGQFAFDQDIDNDAIPDNIENFSPDDATAANISPLHYAFFLSGTAGVAPFVDQPSPQILQRIANGEAVGIGADTAPSSNLISNNENSLLITDLFVSANARPIVFTLINPDVDAPNAYKLQITADNTAAMWTTALGANSKIAIAWLELVRNENLSGSLQAYAEAVAIVGNSRSYVQRLIGEITVTLNDQAALTQ